MSSRISGEGTGRASEEAEDNFSPKADARESRRLSLFAFFGFGIGLSATMRLSRFFSARTTGETSEIWLENEGMATDVSLK